jgi:uncharacterized membrane protein
MDKNVYQIAWGIVLTITGVLVILQIPDKFAQMGDISPNNIFAKLCFYALGFLLVFGGLKKIMNEVKSNKNKPSISDNT